MWMPLIRQREIGEPASSAIGWLSPQRLLVTISWSVVWRFQATLTSASASFRSFAATGRSALRKHVEISQAGKAPLLLRRDDAFTGTASAGSNPRR